MDLKLAWQDGTVTSVSATGSVTQDAFAPEEEPLERQFGPDIYATRVVLGLAKANYLDSRGVGWLLKCHKRFREAGGALVLHSMSPEVKQVLRVLRLDQVLELADDEQAACARAAAAVAHE
ncbi:MAG: STAS domain-containing protein [Planctomycetia bacterium]|nr:STAS domain-containing protein [Planctomycetia bacterium]